MISIFPLTVSNSPFPSVAFFIALAALLPYFYRRADAFDTLPVGRFFAVWAVAWLFEYFYLGPNSFAYPDDEANWVIPFIRMAAETKGTLSHLIAADHDVRASFLTGGAWITLDSLLLTHLPTWIAILLHKAVVVSLLFWGTWLLAVRTMGCRPLVGTAFAALTTLSTHLVVLVTFATGITRAILPLACWLAVGRLGQRHYWTALAAYSLVAALCMIPVEGFLPLGSAILATAVLTGRRAVRDWLRICGAIIVLATPAAINWADSLYGMAQISPLTPYATMVAGQAGITQQLETLWRGVLALLPGSFNALPALMSIGGIVALFALRSPRAKVALAAMLTPFALFATYALFPWEALHLGILRGVTADYLLDAQTVIAPLIGAMAADRLARTRFRAVIAGVLSLACALMVYFKVHDIGLHYLQGGQSSYRTENLVDPRWAPSEPFRTVSVLHKYLAPEQNVISGFHGIAAFDQFLNLHYSNFSEYWREGVWAGQTLRHINLYWEYWDGQGYDFGQQVSVPLLALANVRFVLSPLPLKGEQLTRVDGPDELPADRAVLKIKRKNDGDESLRRRMADFWNELRWHVRRMFHYGKVYVYEVKAAKPRAYGATGVVPVDDGVDPQAFLRQVAVDGSAGKAVVRRRVADGLPQTPTGEVRVEHTDLVTDGYDLAVEAPAGGIVLVNSGYTPFLVAQGDDGTALQLFEANGIQTGIIVPAGTRRIQLRHHRRSVWEPLQRVGK